MTGEMDAYSSYYADETNYVKIDARTVFNALLRYDTSFGKINKAAVFLRVDNVFNKDYYNAARGSGDSNNDGVVDAEDISYSVNPGRVWTAGLTMQF